MINKISYFVSWSGGKDSCLALFRAMEKYGKPKYLLTMLTENGDRSRSHGIDRAILQKQANLLQIPIYFCAATWNNYEATFIKAMKNLKKQGVKMGVFGDINYTNDINWKLHRQWADQVCHQVEMISYEPLWDDSVHDLLQEFFEKKWIAKIIAVNSKILNKNYLGKILNKQLIDEFLACGIDPAGEKGEYHTIVLDGPLFTQPLLATEKESVLKNDYWFLNLILT